MDNPPGKYLPANFNIFDFFFGSPSANTLAYNSNKNYKNNHSKSSMNIQNSHYTNEKMDNYVNNKMNLMEDKKDNKDNKEITESEKKAGNRLVQGMIGGVLDALTNVVSKITNFTSTVNRSMSVTIVPQDSCYPTEYFVRPLMDGENLVANADDSTLTNTRIRYYQNYINKSHTMETVNNLSSQKPADIDNNYLNSMWYDSMQGDNYYYHQNINPDNLYSAQSNELELAIEESLKLMKINCKSHDSGSAQSETDFTQNPSGFNTEIQTPMTEIPDSKSLSKVDDTESMEFDDSFVDLSAEQILKVKSSSKKRRRSNNNNGAAQSRGKNRRRVPLRRFAAGQLKHKKERNKHFIYSGIQDDLNTWEEEINDESDELCSIISSSDDECTDDQKKCLLNDENSCVIIEKLTFGDPPLKNVIDEPIIKDLIDKTTLSESFNHSNECLPPVKCDYQKHRLSECSVESEDSDVVFEDEDKDESESEIETETETETESESECSDDSEYDDDNDDDDDNEYSDDEFIQFETEESSPICPKVRFNLQPTVHTIIKWNFAYRAARKGPWEQMARDRDRFQTRINSTGRIIEPVLATQHRDCIWKDRFAATD